jgi:hypothetical protein
MPASPLIVVMFLWGHFLERHGLEFTDLKSLAALAERYQLPKPPRESRLVLAHSQWWTFSGSNEEPKSIPIYTPAFLVKENPDKSIVIFRASKLQTIGPFGPTEPLCRPFSLESVDPARTGYEVHLAGSLVIVVDLYARGDHRMARQLLSGIAEEAFKPGVSPRPELDVADSIVRDLEDRVGKGSKGWEAVHKQMGSFFREFPELYVGERMLLYRDLQSTLLAEPPPCDSIEAVLLKWASRPHKGDDEGEGRSVDLRSWNDLSSEARAIISRGFGAVPELLTLLDDSRITTLRRGIDYKRVGDLADELLWAIVGSAAPLESGTGFTKRIEPARWREWWEKNKRLGEYEYYRKLLYHRNVAGQVEGTNANVAFMIARRFPDRLAGLYRDNLRLASPSGPCRSLIEAAVHANVSEDKRFKIMVELAECDPASLREVLAVAIGTDMRLVDRLLKAMTPAKTRPYRGYPQTVLMASCVAGISDHRAWKKALQVARDSDVGVRLEMIAAVGIGPAEAGWPGWRTRVAFLSAFLDDDAVRDSTRDPQRYDKDSAASDFPIISVRDFAALQLANSLDIDMKPKAAWTPVRWAMLRNEVRRKLAEEQLPKLLTP